jgi:hypothetical protein
MAENIFYNYFTKENLIHVINFLSLDLLMSIVENKYKFKQKLIFIYGDKVSFLPVDKKNHYKFNKKFVERWPSTLNKTTLTIDINDIDDLKIFYIDLIIKNTVPMILFVRSQNTIQNLKDKINFNKFINDHYSKENLDLFFKNLPFFNIHPEVKNIHLHKTNLTNIDQKKAFVINFENNNSKNYWNNYIDQQIFIIRLDDIQFYKLFIMDLIIKKIIPKHIFSISKYSHEELFKDSII